MDLSFSFLPLCYSRALLRVCWEQTKTSRMGLQNSAGLFFKEWVCHGMDLVLLSNIQSDFPHDRYISLESTLPIR